MKIKGIELKAVKEFKDHEGMLITQGNIYFHNKKVGYYSESFMSGPMDITIDDENIEKEMSDLARVFFQEHPNGIRNSELSYPLDKLYANDLIEGILSIMIDLRFNEKEYKKMVKKGYPFVVWYKKSPKHCTEICCGFRTEGDYLKKLDTLEENCLMLNAASLDFFTID